MTEFPEMKKNLSHGEGPVTRFSCHVMDLPQTEGVRTVISRCSLKKGLEGRKATS